MGLDEIFRERKIKEENKTDSQIKEVGRSQESSNKEGRAKAYRGEELWANTRPSTPKTEWR